MMSKTEKSTDKTPYTIAAIVLSCVALIVSVVVLYCVCERSTISESDVVSFGGIVFGVAGVVFTTFFLIFAYRARIIQDDAYNAKRDAEDTFEAIKKELKNVQKDAEAAKTELELVKTESRKAADKTKELVSTYTNILEQIISLNSNPDIQSSLVLNRSRIECVSESSIEKRRIAIATIGHSWRTDYEKQNIKSDIDLLKRFGQEEMLKKAVESAVNSLEKQLQ